MAALIDTGIFFGYYSIRDEHHMDSVALVIHAVEGKWGKLFITNHILDETLTLLKYKKLPVEAFIEAFIDSQNLQILHVDENIEHEALKLFKERLYSKGFSYTDAISEIIAKEFELIMMSYDSGFQVETIGRNYWMGLEEEERKRIVGLVDRLQRLE